MDFRVFDEISGTLEMVTLQHDVLEGLVKLPEAPERYFLSTPNALLLPVSSLMLSHLRVAGIRSANNLMLGAYEGKNERRLPVTLKKIENNYLVIDGNSTVVNAIYCQWEMIFGCMGED